jgi:chemotaxis protein MotB
MKLDEGIQPEKLSLDMTPLIDIVFLLVLFFAVSTSFISSEDLNALQDQLAKLVQDKETLDSELKDTSGVVVKLESQLLSANDRTRELASTAKTLEQQRIDLRKSLDTTLTQRQTLETRLAQELRDRESLNLEISGLKRERDKQSEQDQMLRATLLERAKEAETLQAQLQDTRSRLNTASDKITTQEEKQRALQARLAEKASQYEALELRLARSKDAEDALSSKLGRLKAENEQQAQRLTQMGTEMSDLQSQLAKFRELAELDRVQIDRILKAQQNLTAGLDQYVRENKLGIKRENQRLVLQLSNQILFDSGSAALKSEGLQVLRAVGNAIKARLGSLNMQIGGHTDNVPISAERRQFSSNWGLSAARAVNVVRFLEDEVGIDSTQLSAVGYGEHSPVATNDTKQGRALNRRIEIVLLPR